MVVMRWLIVILSVALAVCIYLLVDLREKRRERRRSEIRISSIYKRMYESPWVREMITAVEDAADAVEGATVRLDGVDVPGVYRYDIDTGTTRPFDPYEVFVIAYIIYACLDGERFLPPATERDGTIQILRKAAPPPEMREPY